MTLQCHCERDNDMLQPREYVKICT